MKRWVGHATRVGVARALLRIKSSMVLRTGGGGGWGVHFFDTRVKMIGNYVPVAK